MAAVTLTFPMRLVRHVRDGRQIALFPDPSAKIHKDALRGPDGSVIGAWDPQENAWYLRDGGEFDSQCGPYLDDAFIGWAQQTLPDAVLDDFVPAPPMGLWILAAFFLVGLACAALVVWSGNFPVRPR